MVSIYIPNGNYFQHGAVEKNTLDALTMSMSDQYVE